MLAFLHIVNTFPKEQLFPWHIIANQMAELHTKNDYSNWVTSTVTSMWKIIPCLYLLFKIQHCYSCQRVLQLTITKKLSVIWQICSTWWNDEIHAWVLVVQRLTTWANRIRNFMTVCQNLPRATQSSCILGDLLPSNSHSCDLKSTLPSCWHTWWWASILESFDVL